MTSSRLALACVALAACGRQEPVSYAPSALMVGDEVDLASTAPGAPPETQDLGTVVKTPTGYLAVWTDRREGFGVAPAPGGRAHFARVALDGAVVDPVSIPLPLTATGLAVIQVAGACEPSGTCLLIARSDGINKLLGIRIAGDQVVDATPQILFDAGTSTIEDIRITWDGTAYRVIWREPLTSTVWTLSVQTDLSVGAPVAVASPANNGHLACQGPTCLVVYRNSTAITAALRGRIVSGTGTVGSELMIYLPGGRTFPSAPSWDGQYYWVGLSNNQITTASQYGASVQVVRVAPDGTVLDPDGILVAAGDPLFQVMPPLLGHDGTTTELIWNVLSHTVVPSVKIARVSGAGAVLDPGGAPFSTSNPMVPGASGDVAVVACHAPACLAAWTMPAYLDERIHGTRFAGTTQLDPGGILIARSPAGTMAPAVTYALGQYVAVWRDSRDSSAEPRVSPIRGAAFGTALAPVTELELAPSPQPSPFCRDHEQPAIGASASSYLVVWHDACQYYNNLYGQVLGADAQPAGPPIVVDNTTGQEAHPGVASDGSGFLVVWDNIESQNPVTIHGRWFTAAGVALGAAFPVSSSGNFPVVAFDGAGYLVAWRRVNGTLRDLYAAQVSPLGTVGPELVLTQTPTRSEEGQSVACGGGTCLVAWRAFDQVRATRVSPAGAVLDPDGFVVGAAAGQIIVTSVAWDGSAFVVVWHTASQVRMQRVAATGALLPTTNPTLTLPAVPDRPAVASNGAGHLVALYDRFDATAMFRVRRVRARSIDDDPPPPVDAGIPDAPPDAAMPADAAVTPDAPVDTGSPPDDKPKGCGGCSGGRDPSALGLLVLLARRRRRRAGGCRRAQHR